MIVVLFKYDMRALENYCTSRYRQYAQKMRASDKMNRGLTKTVFCNHSDSYSITKYTNSILYICKYISSLCYSNTQTRAWSDENAHLKILLLCVTNNRRKNARVSGKMNHVCEAQYD